MNNYIAFAIVIIMLVSCSNNNPKNRDINTQTIEKDVEMKKEDSIATVIDTAKLVKDEIDYEFVKIGKQYWMTKNLDVSVFRNGDTIFHAATKLEWLNASKEKKAAWCYYNNDSTNAICCGKLYNWYAVNDPRGLAPRGWKIPNRKELETLLSSVGGHIKSGRLMNTEAWQYEKADNKSGFNAYPCGGRFLKDEFKDIRRNAGFWSLETDSYKIDGEEHSFLLWLVTFKPMVISYPQEYGLSVRCLKE